MKSHTLLRFLSLLLRAQTLLLALVVFVRPAFSQVFETTLGIASGHEECWDGKPIASSNSTLLSNTTSFGGASKILLTRLNANGSQNLNVTLHDASLPGNEFSARSIEYDNNATGGHIGYFITGRRIVGGKGQMTLLRTDLNYNVTWAKFLPSTAGGVTLDECGVSVERQSNGDVVATGRSLNPSTNISRIIMARFTSAGAFVWCFRYGSTNTLSFIPDEACNGLRPSPNPGGGNFGTVAVTGRYTETGVDGNHTFLFLVNATNGAEIWRKTYHSGNTNDEGLDVVYKPAANEFDVAQFMVVGYSGGVHPSVWVVRVNASTGAGAGTVYTAGVYNSGFMARAVALSTHSSGTRAVLAGTIIGLTKPGNPFFSRVWAMELPFAAALPTWTYYYESSNPQGSGNESISRITGTNPGYLITGGDKLIGSANYDEHAIRVLATGKHGLADCPEVSLPVSKTTAGTQLTRDNSKDPFSVWQPLSITRYIRTLVQESCDGVPLGGDTGEREEAVPQFNGENLEAKISPNPSGAGTAVRLAVQLQARQMLSVQIFDLTGKQVFAATHELDEGYRELELPTENLASGAYFVRVQSRELNRTLKWVVNR